MTVKNIWILLDTKNGKHITIFTKEAENSCSSILGSIRVKETVFDMQIGS
jgi:hypothetical protein